MRHNAWLNVLLQSKELTLCGVLIVLAAIEVLELAIWGLPLQPNAGMPEFYLDIGNVMATLAGALVLLRGWQERTALLEEAAQRSAEVAGVRTALNAKEEALARIAERLLVVQEEHRRLMVYEIHDGLAPIIVSAKQHLETFEHLWQCDSMASGPELRKALDRLEDAVGETRRILAALGPGTLESLGLIPAISAILAETAQETGWHSELVTDLQEGQLPAGVETALFRIVQEALANAAKHAQASRVSVALRMADDNLVLEVQDSGIGFPSPLDRSPLPGLGLLSMRRRAHLFGGKCLIESKPGSGTKVTVILPMSSEDG